MDSTKDSAKQLYLSRQDDDFCDNPSCLGKVWHDWGCCSSASVLSSSTSMSTAPNNDCNQTDLVEPGWSLDMAIDELLGMHNQDKKPNTAPAHPTSSRYAIPVTDEAVTRARIESVPRKTRDDSAYCVRLWQDWASNRLQVTNEKVPSLTELDKQGLQYWLSRFVMEIRNKKGKEYAPSSLHHIVCGIMRHLRQNCGKSEIDFF